MVTYGTGHTVLLGAVRSHVPARLAAMQAVLQLQVGSCRLGGTVPCLCLTGVLLWPPEGHPGQPLSWFESYRRLSPKFQFSLFCFTLSISLIIVWPRGHNISIPSPSHTPCTPIVLPNYLYLKKRYKKAFEKTALVPQCILCLDLKLLRKK